MTAILDYFLIQTIGVLILGGTLVILLTYNLREGRISSNKIMPAIAVTCLIAIWANLLSAYFIIIPAILIGVIVFNKYKGG